MHTVLLMLLFALTIGSSAVNRNLGSKKATAWCDISPFSLSALISMGSTGELQRESRSHTLVESQNSCSDPSCEQPPGSADVLCLTRTPLIVVPGLLLLFLRDCACGGGARRRRGGG